MHAVINRVVLNNVTIHVLEYVVFHTVVHTVHRARSQNWYNVRGGSYQGALMCD